MDDLNQKVRELFERLESVKENFNLEEKKKKLLELEALSMDPNLWDNQEKARKLMQDLDTLKKEIAELMEVDGEVSTLMTLITDKELTADFASDVRELEKRLEKLELKSFLSDPHDVKNALVSIHAGQGG